MAYFNYDTIYETYSLQYLLKLNCNKLHLTLAPILDTSFHYINTFRIYCLIFLSYIVASSLDVLDNTYYDTAFI